MIDTHRRHLESIRVSVRRTDRCVTLDWPPYATAKAPRRRNSGATDPARLVRQLVSATSEPSPAAIPSASELAGLIGLGGLSQDLFDEFAAGFRAALTAIGLSGSEQRERQARRWYSAMGGNNPPLPSACGVRVKTRMDRQRPIRRHDEFTNLLSDEANPTVTRNAEGHSPGVIRLARALIRALHASASRNDAAGVRRAGQDFGALAAVLSRTTKSAAADVGRPRKPTPEPLLVQVGKSHFAAPGHELVRRSTNQITGIEVDGETLPIGQVVFVDGEVRRRRQPGR